MSQFAPPGYQQITPYFIVQDASRFIQFLQQSFAAVEKERHLDENGRIMHAVLMIGDSIVEMGESTKQFPPRTSAIHLYMENTDQVYEKALEAGATTLFAPEDKEYGERSAGVEDPFGNHWYIATYQNG